jgi:hypothetical protein
MHIFKQLIRIGLVITVTLLPLAINAQSDYGVGEGFDPENPGNPGRNGWNATTGEVIVDDFITGSLNTTIKSLIGNSPANAVTQIVAAGVINNTDFSVAKNYSKCSLADFSRTAGISGVPTSAYSGCKNIGEILLPTSINEIGSRAFYNCSALTALTCYNPQPPIVGTNAFTGVSNDFVVYVPSYAVALYEQADSWKDFTILPIQESVHTLTVKMPTATDISLYKNMNLKLINAKSGQTYRYILTDKREYAFKNLVENTLYNVYLTNENNYNFGEINGITVEDEDVEATFSALAVPQSLKARVMAGKEDVTAQTTVTWTDTQNNYIGQGAAMHKLAAGTKLQCAVTLPQLLAMEYATPEKIQYEVNDSLNEVIFRLEPYTHATLTGRVVDASTGMAIPSAVVSASQTFGGKYSKTISAKTDESGVYTLTVSRVPTSLAVTATDYISQSLVCDTQQNTADEITVPDVKLKTISGATITLGVTYTSCDGETQNWYSDYQNVSYELFNVTKNKAVSQYNMQYPQIVLLEEIADGDVLRLTASSRINAFKPVTATATLTEQKATAMFNVVELGKIQSSFTTTGNASVVGSLYDAAGKLVKTYNYSNALLTISDLADGNYTLISMGSSRLFNTIYDLAQLPQTGLVEDVDYVSNQVQVKSGQVSTISINEVPTLDESKLYYTGDNTSFTVNKPSIVAGNYLTLTGRIDFKHAYATSVSNVQMIVDLPESCEFVENSVMVGNSTSSYTLNGHQITIPIAHYTDRVRFCIIPTLGGEYAPSAFVQFDMNGETLTQPIGSANYTAKDLSISVPSTVAKTVIPVSGTAIGKCDIEIYDNGVLIGQTTSMANGTWTTTCELNAPYNLSRHQIYAKVTTKQGIELTSENVSCVYDMNAIQVSVVKMYHDNPELHKTYELTFDFLNPSNKEENYIYYIYNKKFTFTIDFTNNDTTKVSDVVLYVKTAKSGWHPLNATYDTKQDLWVATGEFGNMYDEDLPVNVSVDFNKVSEPLIDTKTVRDNLDAFKHLAGELTSSILDDNDNVSIEGTEYDEIDESEFVSLDELLSWNEPFDEDDSIEIDVDSLKESYLNLANLFILQENTTICLPDGVTILFNTCVGIDETVLEEHGYTKYTTVDRKNIYTYDNDSVSVIIDFADNLYFKTIRSNSVVAKARKFSAGDTFIDWTNRIKDALLNVQGAYKDLEEKIGSIVLKLQSDLEKYSELAKKNGTIYKRYSTQLANLEKIKYSGNLDPWQINEINNKIESAKKAKVKWEKLYKAAERSRKLTEKVLPITNKMLPALKKICPVIKYVDMAWKGISVIMDYSRLYDSVPDPCPNDQVAANKCKNNAVYAGGTAFGFIVSKLTAEALTDFGIIGQASSAVATGGVTFLTAFVTAVTKMSVSIAVDTAFEVLNNNTKKALKKEISALNCKEKEPNDENENKENGGEHKSNNPDKKFGIDPSGYVYEAISTNRLEGVTSTIFYKEEIEDMYGDLHENIVKWDAEEYAQENPLFTDENGCYRWDVPQGLWQVKFEKEGYETTYSEWLPVPPPQLEVNIAMKQNVQPNVKNARAFEDAIEIEFDKYMMPDLLTTENIIAMANDKNVEGTIELLNEEVCYEGETEKFASKIRFNAAKPFDATEVTVMVNNRVKSYAGIRMQDNYQQALTIEQEIKQIVCDTLKTIAYGETSTFTVQVLPVSASKGKVLMVKTSSPMILNAETEQVVIGDDGMAAITVTGELPGSAALTYSVVGTDKTAQTIVNVKQMSEMTVAVPKVNIASGSMVKKGTEITLSCETEGAIIYYTLDGSCPCEITEARHVYNGTPIVINENTTIKAMAVAHGMYESEVVEFTYTIDATVIDEMTMDASIEIFPLPVRDKLNVHANGEVINKVVVSTISGIVMATSSDSSTMVTLNVSKIPTGIYVISITTESGVYSRKIYKI